MFVCPSFSTLSKKKHQQNVQEDDNVEVYERILLLMDTSKIIGQLVCDKMKLKGDIAFNVKTNEGKGFTEDFSSAKQIMKNLLHDNSLEGFSKLSTYVNQ